MAHRLVLVPGAWGSVYKLEEAPAESHGQAAWLGPGLSHPQYPFLPVTCCLHFCPQWLPLLSPVCLPPSFVYLGQELLTSALTSGLKYRWRRIEIVLFQQQAPLPSLAAFLDEPHVT